MRKCKNRVTTVIQRNIFEKTYKTIPSGESQIILQINSGFCLALRKAKGIILLDPHFDQGALPKSKVSKGSRSKRLHPMIFLVLSSQQERIELDLQEIVAMEKCNRKSVFLLNLDMKLDTLDKLVILQIKVGRLPLVLHGFIRLISKIGCKSDFFTNSPKNKTTPW